MSETSKGQEQVDWLQFMRRPDFAELNDPMLGLLAHELRDVNAPRATKVFEDMGKGIQGPEAPPPHDEYDDDEEEYLEEEDPELVLDDVPDVIEQISVVLQRDMGHARLFSVMWSSESFDMLSKAWFHYITHDCPESLQVIEQFMDRLMDQTTRAIIRDES